MSSFSLPETRWKFLGLRLALSVVMLALFLGLVRLAWYPGLYFQLSGIGKQVVILTGTALAIGPGLSTLVYRRGKRRLMMDLIVLLAVELIAIGYMGSLLLERRPQHLVFAIDRFQIVAANRIADYPYRFDDLASRPLFEPKLVNARFPDDHEELAAVRWGVLFNGDPDIDVRPDHWYPYEEAIPAVLSAARPLVEFSRRGEAQAAATTRWLNRQSADIDGYVFLPVMGRARDGTVVLEKGVGYPLAMLDVDPWE